MFKNEIKIDHEQIPNRENSSFVNGLPLSVTEPLAAAPPLLSSASMLRSVDLPHPEGPMIAESVPGAKAPLT